MKYILIVLLAVFVIHFDVQSQCRYNLKDGSEKLDSLLDHAVDENGPGFTLAILKGENIIYQRSSGLANIKTKSKINSQTEFYIASLGKEFTSTAILLLVQKGKLNLDDKLSFYVKELPGFASQITIRQMLNQTSGLPDHFDEFGEERRGYGNEVVKAFVQSQDKLLFDPGTSYAYSNSAYVLLAEIIEKVSGMDYEHFISKEIFIPLGMSHTILYTKGDIKSDKAAIGYSEREGKEYIPNDYELYTTGAGGFYSTVDDIIRWQQAVTQKKIINPELWQVAFTPPAVPGKRTYMAMGWNYEDSGRFDRNLFSIDSFGVLVGFRCYLYMIPTEDFAIILLSNMGRFPVFPDTILSYFLEKAQ